ncbi:hypothetical protein TPL01_23510 [Sulfuriferula plumbiphila]|uniref:Uncharacterized protein n=1 Tax=Sulfuriferula plumbiphila TaxID=171865 RepID=A0A512L9Q0_9PROT|nr:hypothetical protein SFPGR_11250 [Sulfuriferula plumbiphila]GEP31213.1 hypothetical protein TPL01_23510 [Sulfuriferula plumbiphila]
MAEFGIVLPQKVTGLRQHIGQHLEDLPGYVQRCIGGLLAHAGQLDAQIARYDQAISQAARENARSKYWLSLPPRSVFWLGPTFKLRRCALLRSPRHDPAAASISCECRPRFLSMLIMAPNVELTGVQKQSEAALLHVRVERFVRH